MDYTSIARILNVEPMVGSLMDGIAMTSAQVVQFAEDAEAEINARIVRTYTLPLGTNPPILQAIATDIAIYRILTRRIFTQERLQDSPWPDKFKESIDLADKIADGEMTLVNSDGTIIGARTDVAEVWSNQRDYHPTMSELGPLEDFVDPDKIDDLRSDRDL